MQTKGKAVVEVDRTRGVVTIKGQEQHVAPKQYRLLCALIEARGAVMTRDELLSKAWGHEKGLDLDTRTVDQHVARLRTRIGKEGRACIPTVREPSGYRGVNMAYTDRDAEPVLCVACRKEINAAKKVLKTKGFLD